MCGIASQHACGVATNNQIVLRARSSTTIMRNVKIRQNRSKQNYLSEKTEHILEKKKKKTGTICFLHFTQFFIVSVEAYHLLYNIIVGPCGWLWCRNDIFASVFLSSFVYETFEWWTVISYDSWRRTTAGSWAEDGDHKFNWFFFFPLFFFFCQFGCQVVARLRRRPNGEVIGP